MRPTPYNISSLPEKSTYDGDYPHSRRVELAYSQVKDLAESCDMSDHFCDYLEFLRDLGDVRRLRQIERFIEDFFEGF